MSRLLANREPVAFAYSDERLVIPRLAGKEKKKRNPQSHTPMPHLSTPVQREDCF